jgi:hypothetical protein
LGKFGFVMRDAKQNVTREAQLRRTLPTWAEHVACTDVFNKDIRATPKSWKHNSRPSGLLSMAWHQTFSSGKDCTYYHSSLCIFTVHMCRS